MSLLVFNPNILNNNAKSTIKKIENDIGQAKDILASINYRSD